MQKIVRIEESWYQQLQDQFEANYFIALRDFIHSAYQQGTVYPPGKQIFRAFDTCPFEKVKVVILGQDPYHEPGQAEGLAFSVPPGITTPPSLVNILKEIESDLGHPSQIVGGSLETWAKQGVLLLNSTLTVSAHRAGSHQGKGWECFTDAVIEILSKKRNGLVFLLWGNYARQKKALVDSNRHLILEAPHPSPLSAHRGFIGCRHFSKTNKYLESSGLAPIKW